MNYLVMDRASEAAANDLAEVRKLIEGMNALVNSQIQQQQQQAQLQAQQQAQQQQQQQQQLHLSYPEYPTHDQQQQDAAMMAATFAAVGEHQPYLNVPPSSSPSLQQTTPVDSSQQEQSKSVNDETPQEPPKQQPSTATTKPIKTKKATKNTTPSPTTQSQTTESPATTTSTAPATDTPATSAPSPQAGVIVEVIHLTFNRVLYFQLAQDATIEPMIAWLRLSYQDAAISGMVLQYKGFDGLWKCLLNRDDSLRRILKQSMKGNTMLQMRVPREQDLLSSGYTDRRLLALTKTERM